MFNHIIVRAAFDCKTLIQGCKSEPIEIKKGDIGVVRWDFPTSRYFPEPNVIWDKDEEKHPRGALLHNLEFVGLERNGHRVIVEFAGSQQ